MLPVTIINLVTLTPMSEILSVSVQKRHTIDIGTPYAKRRKSRSNSAGKGMGAVTAHEDDGMEAMEIPAFGLQSRPTVTASSTP